MIQRGVRLRGDLQRLRGRILFVHGIRIGKEQPIAGCLLGGKPHGMVFPDPAWRGSSCFEQPQLGYFGMSLRTISAVRSVD